MSSFSVLYDRHLKRDNAADATLLFLTATGCVVLTAGDARALRRPKPRAPGLGAGARPLALSVGKNIAGDWHV